MPAGYSREFLIDAALHRYISMGEAKLVEIRPMYEKSYNEYGKDKFRKYTMLTADAIKEYKNWLKNNSNIK